MSVYFLGSMTPFLVGLQGIFKWQPEVEVLLGIEKFVACHCHFCCFRGCCNGAFVRFIPRLTVNSKPVAQNRRGSNNNSNSKMATARSIREGRGGGSNPFSSFSAIWNSQQLSVFALHANPPVKKWIPSRKHRNYVLCQFSIGNKNETRKSLNILYTLQSV